MSKFQQNLTVVIYSHNNSHKVKELIEALNKQDYERYKYSINILLDNCNEENTKFLEIIGGTKLWRINSDNPEAKPLGKFKALSWLFERILACENTNAFVFLNADSKIKSDFLQKVNTAVHYNPVIIGEVLKKKNNFYNRILNFRNKLRNRVLKHGRFHSALGNIIDSELFVIRQEILEKIKFKKTEYGFEEYEYSINLKNNDIPVLYSNEIIVTKSTNETLKSLAVKDYERRYKSFITFRNNFPLLFSGSNLGVKELMFSLFYPSNTVFVFWNLILMFVVKNYPETYFSGLVSFKYLGYLLAFKFLADGYSMFTVRCGFNDYKNAIAFFFVSPVLCVKSMFKGFLTNSYSRPIRKKKKQVKAETLNYDKHTVDATITNGRKELPCKIEIIKTDEYSQAVFMFNNKRLTSSKQPRINYAVEELIGKLRSHGFALKVCANCGYFYMPESIVSHSDGEQGYCLYNNFKNASKEKEYSNVWDGCFNIIPHQTRNYILQQLGVENNKTKI
ncbi:MAG: hypothetical protein A2039_08650 [Candidatus Melainabacteria bacterium GWA2_34_9]|nr:MAG: hypothetical protein A2039_08650 [Candidatus Melainabacteria bacterium GWA2_34_9]